MLLNGNLYSDENPDLRNAKIAKSTTRDKMILCCQNTKFYFMGNRISGFPLTLQAGLAKSECYGFF
jgi:hypothetical protein